MRSDVPRYESTGRTSVQDLDADLVRLRRRDLDVLELEWLTCAPADGGLALDDFASGVGHGGEEERGSEQRVRRDGLPLILYPGRLISSGGPHCACLTLV